MLRALLELILIIVVGRAFWRVVDGIIEGLSGRRQTAGRGRTHVPDRGVPMVRDPVCGTFVLPDRAVTLTDGGRRLFFCSSACRDAYGERGSRRWDPQEAPAGARSKASS